MHTTPFWSACGAGPARKVMGLLKNGCKEHAH